MYIEHTTRKITEADGRRASNLQGAEDITIHVNTTELVALTTGAVLVTRMINGPQSTTAQMMLRCLRAHLERMKLIPQPIENVLKG